MSPGESDTSIGPAQIGHLAVTMGRATVDGSLRPAAVAVVWRRNARAYWARGRRKVSDPWLPHDSHHPDPTFRASSKRFGSVRAPHSAHRRTAPWAATNAAMRAAR